MILISDVYNLLLDEIRTDKRGLSLSPDEFNRTIRVVNEELYLDFVDGFEGDIESSDTMGWFKEYDYNIALVAGVGTLPDNYYQMIGKPKTSAVSPYYRADLVSSYEFACREEDYLTQPTTIHPVFRIGGRDANEDLTINVAPTSIANIWIDYLRVPTTPYLDWYVNNLTYNYTFLAETAVAQTVPLGSTYRDGTAGIANVTSLTVNLEWSDEDLPLIMAKLREKVGIQLPDQLLIETANINEAKLKA